MKFVTTSPVTCFSAGLVLPPAEESIQPPCTLVPLPLLRVRPATGLSASITWLGQKAFWYTRLHMEQGKRSYSFHLKSPHLETVLRHNHLVEDDFARLIFPIFLKELFKENLPNKIKETGFIIVIIHDNYNKKGEDEYSICNGQKITFNSKTSLKYLSSFYRTIHESHRCLLLANKPAPSTEVHWFISKLNSVTCNDLQNLTKCFLS